MRLIDIKDLPSRGAKKPKYVSLILKAIDVCPMGKAHELGKAMQVISMKKSLAYVQAKDPKTSAYKIITRGGSTWLVGGE